MKKRNLFVAAYLMMGAATVFTSCSNDEEVIGIETPEATVEQEIQFQVVSSGDSEIATRASRPLFSESPAQAIDHVDYIIYSMEDGADNGLIIAKNSIDNWMTVSSELPTTSNMHGKMKSIKLTEKDGTKLAEGKYVIYAIGYNTENSLYGYSSTVTPFKDVTVNSTKYTQPYTATLTDKTKAKAEEIFAGALEFEITADDEMKVGQESDNKIAVTLHRQVAGTYGYFKNIPYKNIEGTQEGTKLRLVASGANATVSFDDFNSDFTNSNDANEANKKPEYVVNGSSPFAKNAKLFGSTKEDAVVIYETSFAEWFTFTSSISELDTDKDGYISMTEGQNKWKNPHTTEGGHFMKGTMFASNFVIPFAKTSDVQTLQLQLVDDNSNILRYWNITLNDEQTDQTIDDVKEDANSYSLVRNHLYAVGKKLTNGDTDPDPDPKPDPTDPDQPEDLSKGQNLIIQVNDNWEVIHDMVID